MSRRRPERHIPSRREWPTEITWEDRVADAVDPVFAGDVAHAAGTAWLKVVFALLAFLMVQGVLTALPSSSDLGYGSRSALVLPLVATRALLLGICWFLRQFGLDGFELSFEVRDQSSSVRERKP